MADASAIDSVRRRIAMSEIGVGPSLVFLHGFAGTRHEFGDLQPACAAAGYRTVAIDAPGFGESEPADQRGYGLIQQTDDYAELFRSLGIRDALIVAHSMGAKYALVLARRYAELVRGLVLLAPDGFVEAPPLSRLGRWRALGLFSLWLARQPWMLKRLLRAAYADPELVTPARLARAAAALGTDQRRQALVAMSAQFAACDLTLSGLRGSLAAITQPITIVWGRDDRVFPSGLAQRAQRELPHAQLHVLENCGHFVHEEQPQRVLELILAAAEHGQTGLVQ